jgi:hypothetical protein
MRQKTFSSGLEKHNKKTRKAQFLEEMDQVILWQALSKALAPYSGYVSGRHQDVLVINRIPVDRALFMLNDVDRLQFSPTAAVIEVIVGVNQGVDLHSRELPLQFLVQGTQHGGIHGVDHHQSVVGDDHQVPVPVPAERVDLVGDVHESGAVDVLTVKVWIHGFCNCLQLQACAPCQGDQRQRDANDDCGFLHGSSRSVGGRFRPMPVS